VMLDSTWSESLVSFTALSWLVVWYLFSNTYLMHVTLVALVCPGTFSKPPLLLLGPLALPLLDTYSV
jgi:hypothetical protein